MRWLPLLCLPALAGCIPPILEWHYVGIYGPRPTTKQVYAECKKLLRDQGFKIEVDDPEKYRIESNWTQTGGMAFQKQARIVLKPRRGATYVWLMIVVNENMADNRHPGSHNEAWGPDENGKMFERQMHILLHKRLKRLAEKDGT